MQNQKNIKHIYIAVGILGWIGLAVIDSPEQFDAMAEVSELGANFIKNTF